jgi:aquaporin Z
MNKYITEFIGTFFLVLTVALTGNPIAIGAILMVMVYMGGNISGGHYNPSVTLGVFMRGKIGFKDTVMYWIVQLLGAFFAAFMCFYFTKKSFAPTPGPGVDFWMAAIAEILFTFALVSVVLNTATTKKAAGNSYYGLAIGFTVLAGAFAVGPISGGAFNPAVAAGPILFDTIKGGNSMQYLPMYLLSTILGGALAAGIFKICNQDEFVVS